MGRRDFERERAAWIRRSSASPSTFGRAELPVRHPASVGRLGSVGLTPGDVKAAVAFVGGLAALIGIPVGLSELLG